MGESLYGKVAATFANEVFDDRVLNFLQDWIKKEGGLQLLRFNQKLEDYLFGDALRDFFLTSEHPFLDLLRDGVISSHLSRQVDLVYFDPHHCDPLLSVFEQRIYNLARRMDSERMHIPFRSIHPLKQSTTGDPTDISTYPPECEEIRYNSGNHFSSRPANQNVFEQNAAQCISKETGNLHVLFKRGFLGERLEDIKLVMADLHQVGETQLQFFVICSRHSLQEGHFGTSLLVMDPLRPDFPRRVLVCDTLLKELPQHPRWWNHFVTTFAGAFGDGVCEIIEDLSHPLQKVNIKGDDPFRHDWDCPYYAAAMAEALADLVLSNQHLIVDGDAFTIHEAMKTMMQMYYLADGQLKDRLDIREINRRKRWESGSLLVKELVTETLQIRTSKSEELE